MPPTIDYGSSELGGEPPSDGRPPHGVVAVLVRDGQFLLVQRADGLRAGGWWCFPGGRLNSGEDEPQALVREIQEELGIRVEPVRRLWRAVTAWGVDLSWWQVRWAPAAGNETLRLAPREIAQAGWFSRQQAVALSQLLGSNQAFFRHGIDANLT